MDIFGKSILFSNGSKMNNIQSVEGGQEMYLRLGSKGDLVQEVQSKLTELGFDPGPIDGIYGQKTRKAVSAFQESKGLQVDGVAGPISLKKLGVDVMSEENRSIVRRYVEEVWNHGNLDVIDEIISPDYVNYTNLSSQAVRGPEGIRRFVAAVRNGFSDLRLVIDDQVSERDMVVTRYSIYGTHSGEFAGLEATGKPVTISVISMRLIVDGKFLQGWTYADTLSLCRQFGVEHINLDLISLGTGIAHMTPEVWDKVKDCEWTEGGIGYRGKAASFDVDPEGHAVLIEVLPIPLPKPMPQVDWEIIRGGELANRGRISKKGRLFEIEIMKDHISVNAIPVTSRA